MADMDGGHEQNRKIAFRWTDTSGEIEVSFAYTRDMDMVGKQSNHGWIWLKTEFAR